MIRPRVLHAPTSLGGASYLRGSVPVVPRRNELNRSSWLAAAAVLVLAAASAGPLGACSAPVERSISRASPGPVTVAAASSFTSVLDRGLGALEAEDARWDARASFAGSQDVVRQVREGAPVDVVVLADRPTMQALVDDDLVAAPVAFATNRLALAVAPGNPHGLARLEDLAAPGLRVALADPAVPAGRYAARALEAAGVALRPASLELDVRAALARVRAGEADAAVVYATDGAAAHGEAELVELPSGEAAGTECLAAVVRGGANPGAARAFVRELRSGTLRRELDRAGFGAAP